MTTLSWRHTTIDVAVVKKKNFYSNITTLALPLQLGRNKIE